MKLQKGNTYQVKGSNTTVTTHGTKSTVTGRGSIKTMNTMAVPTYLTTTKKR